MLLWHADAQQRCRWFSQRWHEFAGATPGADAEWSRLIHPDDRAPGQGGLIQDLLLRRDRTRTLRLRRADGVYRWMLATATTLRDGDGGLAGYLGACTDITEVADAHAELQRQRERLERELHFAHALNRLSQLISGMGERDQLLEALALLLGKALGLDRSLVFDIDLTRRQALGLSEWLNPACPQATSVKADYPLSLFPESLRHLWEMRSPAREPSRPAQSPPESEGSAVLLHDGMEIQSLLWHPIDFRADGFLLMAFNQVSQRRVWQAEERRFLDAVANLVTLALQRIRITEEHRHSQERRRLGERVAAMAQVAGGAGAALERALAAMGEAVDRLAACGPAASGLAPSGLAASGLAASGLAAGASGAADQSEQLQSLQRALASARQTTAQLLGLARCRAQRPQPLTAAAVGGRLRAALAALPGRQASCRVNDQAPDTQLRADPVLLDQALAALAAHLLRALPAAGELAVTVQGRALDPAQARRLGLEPGDFLAIAFALSATARRPALPGIEHALHERAAVQGDGDDHDLGLISAAAIVTCMDGAIAAREAEGPCTALTVYLPVAPIVEVGRQATPLRLPALGGRETVLLVEDDPALLGLVGDSLRHLGYQVLSASSGQEALRVAERHAGGIDLLLTDVVLPQLGGHALAAQLVPACARTCAWC